MTNYTGTSGDDEFIMDFVPVSGETYDGADGTDTIVVNDGTLSGGILQAVFTGSTLINFEILQFGIPRITLTSSQADQIGTLVGNDEQNSLIIVVASGSTYQMPDFTLSNWTDGTDYLVLTAPGGGNTTLIARDGLATLQVLSGGTGSDTLIGSNGDDYMIGGNGFGFDTMTGGAGDDTFAFTNTNGLGSLDSFHQDDVVDGGDDTDTIRITGTINLGQVSNVERVTFVDDPSAVLNELFFNDSSAPELATTASYSGVGDVHFGVTSGNLDGSGLTVEAGSNVTFFFHGSGQNDTIVGTAYDDVIYGGGGNNLLSGGVGDDVINSGSGDDTLDGGPGTDTARFLVGTLGGIFADLVTGTASGDGSDTLVNIENLHGSAYADSFFGNALANTIWGDDGNDLLVGRNGDDTLFGGNGNDRLEGGNQNDTLIGGSGDDTLFGGNGNDTLQGGAGADQLVGGAGQDVADYADADSGVEVDFVNPGLNTGYAAGDTYNLIEDILGSSSNDSLAGNGVANVIWGEDGNDRLVGRNGDDTLYGGTGNDTLEGGNQNDALFGDSGDDTLYGGNGDDTLSGGEGNDLMFGGSGNDIFAFDVNSGDDVIRDFLAGAATDDVLDFSALGIAFGDLSIVQQGGDTLITTPGLDTILLTNTLATDLDMVADFLF